MKKTMLVLMGMGALDAVIAADVPGNLVANGDFSQSDCYKDWCIFNYPNAVRNWIPEPEIEVGYGSVYSTSLGQERVLELAPNANTCVKQLIKNVEPGCYELKFQWGARKDRQFDDCKFNVSLNGKVLKSFIPNDYGVKSETIHVNFDAGCEAELKFCGFGGVNNSYGAFIKSVSLVKRPSIPTYPQVPQYPQFPQIPNPQFPQIPQIPAPQYPQIPQIPTPQFPQAPNYGAQQFPPVTVNIPVLTPPTINLPPVVIPNLPNPVLPNAPTINLPTIQPPNFQFPNINFPVLNPPVLNPPTLPPAVIFDPLGFFVESHSQQCYNREYNLQAGGEIEIEFDYKILTNLYVRDSAVIISWDGKQVGRALPSDSGKTIRFKINTSKGCHQLRFCAAGCATDNLHQISIKNVAIYEKQCVGGWGKDIVVNGGFEQNSCASSWCLWTASNIQNNVPGWTPSPEIEVGRGTVYNDKLGTSWVSELDPNRNTCIKQKLPLKPGKALLNFDWAGRVGVSYESSQFDVKLNNQVIQSFRPKNNEVTKEAIELKIDSCPVESEIQFCGTGTSESYGALVDNIKMANWDECLTQKVVKY